MKFFDTYRHPDGRMRVYRFGVTGAYLGLVAYFIGYSIGQFSEGHVAYGWGFLAALIVPIGFLVLFLRDWRRRDIEERSRRRYIRSVEFDTSAIPVVPSSEATSPEHYAMMRAMEGESFTMHRGEDGDWYDSTTGEKLPIQDGDR